MHYLTVHYFITHGPMQRPALLWTHLTPPLEPNLNNYKGFVGYQLFSSPGSCLPPRKTTVHLTVSYWVHNNPLSISVILSKLGRLPCIRTTNPLRMPCLVHLNVLHVKLDTFHLLLNLPLTSSTSAVNTTWSQMHCRVFRQ